MTPSEKHNEIAREFVMKVVRDTGNHSELMVVVESAVLAAMLVTRRAYGMSPAACVEMIEMAVQQATDRFADQERSA